VWTISGDIIRAYMANLSIVPEAAVGNAKVGADFTNDAVIVGGCGHVGLPLGIALADTGLSVRLYDISEEAVATVNAGTLPFREIGADELLRKHVAAGTLVASTDPAVVANSQVVIVVIGTPVDEHLNPDPYQVPRAVGAMREHLRNGQLVILRSTIYPGATAMVARILADLGLEVDVAFCPERIAEGHALEELHSLPQLVAGCTPKATERAAAFFKHLAEDIVEVTPEEAELAKLFTNTWRYIKFATANQFYMIANDYGVDFERVRHAIRHDYPRAADMPGPGFAAGPCLFKDAMQLGAFNNNNFALGHSAMLVNEGLPLYVVARLERSHELSKCTVGILGMAFKSESDDTRSSLSYKLKRVLRFKAKDVLCTDPYVTTDPDLAPLDRVLEESDILIIATPHKQYATISTSKPIVDMTNLLGEGVLV
jgi:UDP-N-acetyl-D-mannosaminuronic acid dehydrogenase